MTQKTRINEDFNYMYHLEKSVLSASSAFKNMLLKQFLFACIMPRISPLKVSDFMPDSIQPFFQKR